MDVYENNKLAFHTESIDHLLNRLKEFKRGIFFSDHVKFNTWDIKNQNYTT